jgi:hypothetical protein
MKTGQWFCNGDGEHAGCGIVNVPPTAQNPICPVCCQVRLQWLGTAETKKDTPPKPKRKQVAGTVDNTFAANAFAHMREVAGVEPKIV